MSRLSLLEGWIVGAHRRKPRLVPMTLLARLDAAEALALAQTGSQEAWEVVQQHFERRRERIEQGPRWEERGGHIIPRYD